MDARPTNRILERMARPLTAVFAAALVVAFASVPAQAAPSAAAPAPAPVPHATSFTIAGDTAAAVVSNTATPRAHHAATATLSLNVSLGVRDSQRLDAVIRAASTPGSTAFGHYLTAAQYMAEYAPTGADVTAVRSWLTGAGLHVTGVSPDNLIVSAEASTATVERAFAVTVNDYRTATRTFFSNDVAPSVPAGLNVHWISGLNDSVVPKSFAQVAPAAVPSGGYRPSDFQQGYNVNGVPLTTPHRANAQSIGFTLWGAPLVQSDLTNFATNTSSQLITVGGAGQDGINFIPCSTSTCTAVGPDSSQQAWDETALDVESAHGVAPGSHLKYWLASTTPVTDPNPPHDVIDEPDFAAVENAVSAAANDSTVSVVSNSWGFNADVDDPTMDTSLQHAAAVGKTFYFSSDDTSNVSYPATSPYVVSVGGTVLNLATTTFNYVSEQTWSGSGTGCTTLFARPSWQIGVGAATCSGRAEPDVAAAGAPATGAYVFYGGGHQQVGGTSLSTPLWAGMTAIWNEALTQAGKPDVGLVTPALYAIGNNPSVYTDDFHDVTSGASGGHSAGTGWDEVTGWGSPNLANLVAQYINATPTTTTLVASSNPVVSGHTVAFNATVSPTPSSGTVAFRIDGVSISGCSSVAPASGVAHCTTPLNQPGSFRVQASYTGNATLSGSPSNTIFERVNAPPPPPPPPPGSGYWMVGATGDVYGFGSSKSAGNAHTSGVTHLEPTPSRHGYWIVNRAGQVFAFGDAPKLGNASGLVAGESVSSLSSTPTGHGYWLFTSRGRALRFGDAAFFGDLSALALNQPVIGSVATPTGHGYYMVAADGGIFAFGDATFHGSTGGIHLNQPVNGLVPTPTNHGYWMVASDGGIFAFGDASFRGSMGGTRLNKPVVGMVRYGSGYLMVGSDGGIFDFSDKPFLGSLAGKPLAAPIVSVAS